MDEELTQDSNSNPNLNLTEVSQERPDFYNYDKAKEHATRLIDYWERKSEGIIAKAQKNREARSAVADVEAMRSANKLAPNHTYVSVRMIDNNVVGSMPAHLMYLKQSRRLGIFQPVDSRLTTKLINEVVALESEFTRVMTYPGWETDYIRLLDGSALHGRDWLEVLEDESKPGNCAINHVGIEYLLHDINVIDVQSSRMVLRSYAITLVDLQRMAAAMQFNNAVVKELKEKLEQDKERDVRVIAPECKLYIYRMFFKDDAGRVHEAWITKDSSTWLSNPKPFYNGISKRVVNMVPKPVNEGPAIGLDESVTFEDEHQTVYPFFKKLHRITEDGVIVRSQGRAFLDYYKQDAASAVLTAFVNGCLDGSCTMWAPSTGTATEGSAPKQTTMVIENGRVWDQPMTAFHTPYPESTLLSALDKIGTLNQAETAQVNWAVINRQGDGGRKTATEIDASENMQTQMSGVEVLMFSLTLTEAFNYGWKIVQSAALADKIRFMVMEDGSNNKVIIAHEYYLKPAGDVDFVERQQNVKKMQEDWPVIQNTPLRDMFLEDYIRMRYADQADKYIAALRAGSLQVKLAQTLQQAMAIIQQAVTDENGQVLPAWRGQIPALQQLAQQGQALIQQAQPQAQQSQQTQQPQ